MTGTSHVASSAKTESVLKGISPTPVSSPGAVARKILQSRRPTTVSSSNNQSELLPEEAQTLKELLLASPPSHQHSRFSFSKLRRVVLPPVQIPPELNTPNALSNIVGGSKIPMTKAMWTRRRARVLRRLPGRIDERVAW